MSLFGKLFRSTAAAASVALGAGAALAQEPASAPPAYLEIPGLPGQEPVTPVAGFGRGGLLGNRGGSACPSPYTPCTPATPCPVTGQPLTPGMGLPYPPGTPPGTPPGMPPGTPPGTPPGMTPAPGAPDIGDRSSGADVGPSVGLPGYIENAVPVTMARVRFDSAYGNNRPDRGNFFYAKCGCFRPQPDAIGPPKPEKNVDYQELTTTGEYAFTQRFSAFFDLPVRFINPDVNRNDSGLGDVGFGMKYAFLYTQRRVMSAFLRFQAPSGQISTGLGNGNWWVEPGVLFLERLNPNWQVFGELRFQLPLGLRTNFVGNLVRYGLGTSYIVAQGQWGYVAPVAEIVGWTVLSGQELDPDLGNAVAAHGDTIVNAKLGVRIGFGAAPIGSPALTRNDLYLGYGRALTGEVWYQNMFRIEYRRFF